MIPKWLSAVFFFCLVFRRHEGSFVTVNENGGYENIVVAISSKTSVANRDRIIYNIQDILTKVHERLQDATDRRVHFQSISILVPDSWDIGHLPNATFETFNQADIRIDISNPLYGDKPYTLQSRSCGQPGHFIHLTTDFLSSISDLKVAQLLREWSRYRYGVFDEYGEIDSLRFPSTYTNSKNGQVTVTGCASPYPWIKGDSDICTTFVPQACNFILDEDIPTKSSLMDKPILKAFKFCTRDTHDREAPTPLNHLCQEASTWEVISRNEDFNRNQSDSKFVINFNKVKYVPMKAVVIIDSTLCDETNTKVYRTFKEGMKSLILEYFPNGGRIGLIVTESQTHIHLRTIDAQERQKIWMEFDNHCPPPNTTVQEPNNIPSAIDMAKSMLEQNKGGAIFLMASGLNLAFSDIFGYLETGTDDLISLWLLTYPPSKHSMSGYKGSPLDLYRYPHLHWYNILEDSNNYPNDVCDVKARMFLENTLAKIIDEYQQGFYQTKSLVYNKVHRTGQIPIELGINFPGKLKVIIYPCAPLPLDPIFSYKGDDILFKQMDALNYVYEKEFDKGNTSFTIKYKHDEVFSTAVVIWFYNDSKSLNVETRVDVGASRDLTILRAIVRVDSVPVVNANVDAIIIRPDGKEVQLKLLDSGNGDPDIFQNDGIYSRYFTEFEGFPGLYSYTVRVTGNDKTTVLSSANSNEMHNFFSVESFGSFYSDSYAASSDVFPPNLILDFLLETINPQWRLAIFRWTPPGDDYDNGKVASYKFQCSLSRDDLDDASTYSIVDSVLVLSNSKDNYHRMHWLVPQEDHVYFCAIVAFDEIGNSNSHSNIVSVYVSSSTGLSSSTVFPNNEISDELSRQTIVVIAVIVTFLVQLFITIIVGLLVYRKKISEVPTRRPNSPLPSAPPKDPELSMETIDTSNNRSTLPNEYSNFPSPARARSQYHFTHSQRESSTDPDEENIYSDVAASPEK